MIEIDGCWRRLIPPFDFRLVAHTQMKTGAFMRHPWCRNAPGLSDSKSILRQSFALQPMIAAMGLRSTVRHWARWQQVVYPSFTAGK
jgi:hypothetical protein